MSDCLEHRHKILGNVDNKRKKSRKSIRTAVHRTGVARVFNVVVLRNSSNEGEESQKGDDSDREFGEHLYWVVVRL